MNEENRPVEDFCRLEEGREGLLRARDDGGVKNGSRRRTR